MVGGLGQTVLALHLVFSPASSSSEVTEIQLSSFDYAQSMEACRDVKEHIAQEQERIPDAVIDMKEFLQNFAEADGSLGEKEQLFSEAITGDFLNSRNAAINIMIDEVNRHGDFLEDIGREAGECRIPDIQ